VVGVLTSRIERAVANAGSGTLEDVRAEILAAVDVLRARRQ